MPTYVYRCENDHIFEATQSIHDEPITRCGVVPGQHRASQAECDAPCERVIQAPFFKITGAGVHAPGLH
jgi:predicted nucleic acid-binding Zn ribbon protein